MASTIDGPKVEAFRPTGLLDPQLRAFTQVMDALSRGRNVVLQSPTGSGKTRMASEILRWSEQVRDGGIFYVNRKSLVTQTRKSFEDLGIAHGVRAADHEEAYDPYWPIQIASANTEAIRVYGSKASWDKHDCSVAIVDEGHIQGGKVMKHILDDHMASGVSVVIMSATPIGMSKFIPDLELVVGGSLHEFRKCGLLVPAVVKSIEQPDLSKVKRNATGEFVIAGEKRRIYTQTIVGNVIDRWKKYNPDARPTMLYAPGKPESVWFCKKFNDAGVPWCHVDATEAYFDGKRYSLTRSLWDEILEKYTDGTFKGISSRFKLREGVDVPSTYHIILATPIGSLSSYLQTVGRGLRSAPGKEHCLITDHGGCYWRHGSPNHDRDWEALWKMSSNVASSLLTNDVRNGDASEPIRCPRCEGERIGGIKCPHCGYVHAKSRREVVMEDGRISTKDGPLVKPKKVKCEPDTQAKWDRMYFGYKRKRAGLTFSQMEAFFFHQHGYWPKRELINMPLAKIDWNNIVENVPREGLRRPDRPPAAQSATQSESSGGGHDEWI